MSNVQFRISSALKTIIGKELITDDFIAVFELVKNAFDAQAKRVDITFDSLGTPDAKIIIQDNGDGMNKEDIIGKWLFVAYSAKKRQQDYRDKINAGRVFAGAKGIGRFSCDSLGEKLRVYTKKKGEKGSWNVLDVNWSRFEADPEKEFQNIPAQHTTQASIPYDLRHGTILEIEILRNGDWNRDKLLELRRSLERLVNPNQENDADNFQIHLHCPTELSEDMRLKSEARKSGEEIEAWQLVNGPIKNFVFETLHLKTAQIVVQVDPSGETITTRLTDRGRDIYVLLEKNPFNGKLHDIRIHLFALNAGAKNAFTRRMGVRPAEYGSVFLYKNGFRIHPFGDPSDDKLGIDKRHQHGVFRTLGTRDLSGRIEINGINPNFQETSSRDGGLIQTAAFHYLLELFIDYALKRLETFFIDIARFGIGTGELPDSKTMSKSEVQQVIFDIIAKLTRSKDVIKIEYNSDFLNILKNKSAESVSALLGNLKRIAAQQDSPELSKEISKAEEQLKNISKAKEEAEEGERRERERAKAAEEKAREAQAKQVEAEEAARKSAIATQEAERGKKQLNTQNVFLKSVLSKDLEHVVSLHHSVGQDALAIENYAQELLSLLRGTKPPSPEQLKVSLERISKIAKKIGTITKFATHANHIAAQEEAVSDLIEYIREYLLNVYGGVIADNHKNWIPINFQQADRAAFVTRFAPIDISIVFDNLLSNARKHHAKRIDVKVVECSPERLVVSFADNGDGIPRRNMVHLFKIGFTTTDGSGLGLHHIREIMTEMEGGIAVNQEKKPGAEFVLTFPKR
ncbi:MAG TPA: sensor histidine kinase [Candidatus Sulfotelmatobacter sp.]|jgi:signal transduction histidine kinase|nr:sensor histidine kinase [Candidatus Sulfotelmatobacter sp.]